ncbi:NADP-dependent oxidoreductase, partial [Rhodococcus erythropolis]|nr:NADP-dependent oxidoreductase [Rhodococcus erythropolis]
MSQGIDVIGVASESKRTSIEGAGARWVASGDAFAGEVSALYPDGVDAVFDLVGGDTLTRGA